MLILHIVRICLRQNFVNSGSDGREGKVVLLQFLAASLPFPLPFVHFQTELQNVEGSNGPYSKVVLNYRNCLKRGKP